MQKFVVAVLVAVLALTLVGCGGGGDAATTEQPADAAAEKPAAAPAAEEAVVDRSANDSDIAPGPFPSFSTTDTPAVFAEKLAQGRPMLIVFYDDAQQVTPDLLAEVAAVMERYRGLIDLIEFSVGGDTNSPDVQAAVTYASELGVASTPYLLVVDGGGYITWRSKGFAERTIIQREVERATR